MPFNRRHLFIASFTVSLVVHTVLLSALEAYAVLREPFWAPPKPRIQLLRPGAPALRSAPRVPGTLNSPAGNPAASPQVTRSIPPKKSAVLTPLKKNEKKAIKPDDWEGARSRELAQFKTTAERKLFLTYFELLSLSVRAHTVYPGSAEGEGRSGTVYLVFTLRKTGRLLKLAVSRSSGSRDLDQAALAAVRGAAPFPQFPNGLGKNEITFHLKVRFSRVS